MRSKMFWGIIFIAIGIILILNYVFGLHMPIMRTLFAIFLIYTGIKMLFGNFGMEFHKYKSETQAIFSESDFKFSDEGDNSYNTVFGTSRLDLTNTDLQKIRESIEINTVFGSTRVKIPKNFPIKVKAEVAFGRVVFPTKEFNALGETTYTSDNFKSDQPYLKVKAHAVFGDIRFETE
jgi:predicted membrane protein